MKHLTNIQIMGRWTAVILALALIAVMTQGQNLVVSGSGSFSGNGVINVKGNINTSAAAAAVAIPGTVNLNGTTAAQQLGGSGSNMLTFATLTASGSTIKQMDVNVTVTDALTVNIAGGLNLDLQANTLTLSGTSTLTTGSLNVSNAASTVVYNGASAQTILGLAYTGAVTLTGAGAKNLSAAASVAGAFSQSGGNLTVNHNMTISNATPTFATIADVTGNSTLALSGTGAKTIGHILGITSGSTITNTGASGVMTIDTLSGNSGAIDGGVGLTFATAAVNGGNITGGTGAVTFSNTLAQSAGTITSGAGGVVFNGIPTLTGGTITAGNSDTLYFNTDIANNSGTISLTGTGSAYINGNFSSVGTLNFANGSHVIYNGAAQTVPAVTYGNVTLAGTGAKTGASGNITLAGNLVLNQNLDVWTNSDTLTFSSAGTVTGASEIIGAVRRSHTLNSGVAYAFNRPEVTMQFANNNSSPVTIAMRPGVAPTGVGANYVNRYYGVSSAADLSTNNATLQLYYTDAERVGSLNEGKYGFEKYTTSLSKLSTNGGSYTRNIAGATNTISLASVNQGLAGVTQFAITPIGFFTIANGNWDAVATWGSTADDIPAATDDAEVRHTVGTGVGNKTIANLTITADATYSGVLNVDNANFNATTITSTGNVNVSATRTLTVSGAFAINSGANATKTVTISGIGTLASVTNNGTFSVANGGVANLTGAFSNNVGSSLTTIGTGALTLTGADLTNAGSITNAGTITVQ